MGVSYAGQRAGRRERPRGRIIELGARRRPGDPPGRDQDLAALQQRRRVLRPRGAHAAGQRERSGGGIVDLRAGD